MRCATLACALLLAAGTGAAGQEAARSPNPWAGLSLDALTATVEAPLFAPGRRSPPPPVVVAPEPAPAEPDERPPDLALVGVVVGSNGSVALLQERGGGEIRRVREGEIVAGWRLIAVAARAVELERGERRLRLVMFAPDGNGGALEEQPGALDEPHRPD